MTEPVSQEQASPSRRTAECLNEAVDRLQQQTGNDETDIAGSPQQELFKSGVDETPGAEHTMVSRDRSYLQEPPKKFKKLGEWIFMMANGGRTTGKVEVKVVGYERKCIWIVVLKDKEGRIHRRREDDGLVIKGESSKTK
ncbi:hypothetical protein LTR74_007139 [Friedmanniomyces endolithicus]|nr:hypothetical protein LTR74_007139 [Friedmanniomyces endolithicus]